MNEENKYPNNLEESYEAVLKLATGTRGTREETEGFIKAHPLNSFLGQVHHGFGMSLRNKWKLWTNDDTPISKWLTDRGIDNGDDKSHVILAYCWHRANGKLDEFWDLAIAKPLKGKAK